MSRGTRTPSLRITSTYSQGFLNGGVESGYRAAIEVMRRLGVRVPRDIAELPYSPA